MPWNFWRYNFKISNYHQKNYPSCNSQHIFQPKYILDHPVCTQIGVFLLNCTPDFFFEKWTILAKISKMNLFRQSKNIVYRLCLTTRGQIELCKFLSRGPQGTNLNLLTGLRLVWMFIIFKQRRMIVPPPCANFGSESLKLPQNSLETPLKKL